MDGKNVTLVPMGAGGYFVVINVRQRSDSGECTVNIKGTDKEDFEFLLGFDFKEGFPLHFPLRLNDVVISLTEEEYVIELRRNGALMNFEEVVEFFKAKGFRVK